MYCVSLLNLSDLCRDSASAKTFDFILIGIILKSNSTSLYNHRTSEKIDVAVSLSILVCGGPYLKKVSFRESSISVLEDYLLCLEVTNHADCSLFKQELTLER